MCRSHTTSVSFWLMPSAVQMLMGGQETAVPYRRGTCIFLHLPYNICVGSQASGCTKPSIQLCSIQPTPSL